MKEILARQLQSFISNYLSLNAPHSEYGHGPLNKRQQEVKEFG